MYKLPKKQNLDINSFEKILDYRYLTTSYKLYWFLGVFKEILAGKKFITFKDIVFRMITSAWYPLIEFHLNFGNMDQLDIIVDYLNKHYSISKDIKENDLLKFINTLNDDKFNSIKSNFYRYVPYRLLTPFFSKKLRGVKDSKKNKLIKELSFIDKSLYSINDDEKTINIDNDWFDYIIENSKIIEGWVNYKLIYFLQQKNPNVPAIPFKLKPIHKRNLNKAKKFWSVVGENMILKDIYTNENFNETNIKEYGIISIDHFIPWNFVLHDELWNLVPTFKNINSSKNDMLPNLENHLDDFCCLQYNALLIAKKNKISKKILEDYLTINKTIDLSMGSCISKEQFVDDLKNTISPLFQIAKNQGYKVW